jgi:hypothetical protein
MTEDKFRSLALSFPGALEGAHMGHPDFRAGGKIFASLGYPNDGWAMVKLTPAEQQKFLKEAPDVFEPCSGAWGRQGSTSVLLASAKVGIVRKALESAWENATVKTRRA